MLGSVLNELLDLSIAHVNMSSASPGLSLFTVDHC